VKTLGSLAHRRAVAGRAAPASGSRSERGRRAPCAHRPLEARAPPVCRPWPVGSAEPDRAPLLARARARLHAVALGRAREYGPMARIRMEFPFLFLFQFHSSLKFENSYLLDL
jgi:hypothetical protein